MEAWLKTSYISREMDAQLLTTTTTKDYHFTVSQKKINFALLVFGKDVEMQDRNTNFTSIV